MSDAPTANVSGRANRVAPDGSLHAVAARGAFWGNRGALLDRHATLARHHRGRLWIVCLLRFHGRRRTQWQPGRLTELYFLDEATALAAGHRPCGECRHADHRRWKAAWQDAFPDRPADARSIDAQLHGERIGADRRHRTHRAAVRLLPDGVIVDHDGAFWLVHGDHLHQWRSYGYGDVRPRNSVPDEVDVRTPPSTVAVIAAGYAPSLHPGLSGC